MDGNGTRTHNYCGWGIHVGHRPGTCSRGGRGVRRLRPLVVLIPVVLREVTVLVGVGDPDHASRPGSSRSFLQGELDTLSRLQVVQALRQIRPLDGPAGSRCGSAGHIPLGLLLSASLFRDSVSESPAGGLTSALRLRGFRCWGSWLRFRLGSPWTTGRCRNRSRNHRRVRSHYSGASRPRSRSSRPRSRWSGHTRPRRWLSRSRGLPTWRLHVDPRYRDGSRDRDEEPPGWDLVLRHRLVACPGDEGPSQSSVQPMSSGGSSDGLRRDHHHSL
uniref:Uncharacterized protein n=1 Tax=Engystomops pustulosus TaxID=76066 RepID=A0AAV6YU64_ENGPU|nr:hypothetical protein GDO81_022516 [Engystomops pustulosus]